MFEKIKQGSIRVLQLIQKYGVDVSLFISLQLVLGLTFFVVSYTIGTLKEIESTLAKLPVIMQSEMEKTRLVMIFQAEQDRVFIQTQHMQTKDDLLTKMNEIDAARNAVLRRIEKLNKTAVSEKQKIVTVTIPEAKKRRIFGIFPTGKKE